MKFHKIKCGKKKYPEHKKLKYMKKEIFNFIKKREPDLERIINYKIKDTDNDNGFIGEHYIVKCLIKVPDTTIPINNKLKEIEKTCLVNISVFKKYMEKKESVKWL